jgi:2'-5' RNA ligase
MGQIAVDVVLLPDEAMTSRAIEINRKLISSNRPEMVLNRKDCLPHISLAMGCIEEADVAAIRKRLESVARKTCVRELRVVGVIASVNSRGETISLLDVDRTVELQALHEQVMQEMMPSFRYEVSEDMIYDDPDAQPGRPRPRRAAARPGALRAGGGVVAGTTLDWIRTYPQKAAYEHFRPHITVGYGRVPTEMSFPIPFRATRLALCHLGNHCTCRRVLAAVGLQASDGG